MAAKKPVEVRRHEHELEVQLTSDVANEVAMLELVSVVDSIEVEVDAVSVVSSGSSYEVRKRISI